MLIDIPEIVKTEQKNYVKEQRPKLQKLDYKY